MIPAALGATGSAQGTMRPPLAPIPISWTEFAVVAAASNLVPTLSMASGLGHGMPAGASGSFLSSLEPVRLRMSF